MKKHTVDILDDADVAERRMNWVLFQHEQAAILYRQGELEWNPGWPLYTNPDYTNWPEWPWIDFDEVERQGMGRQCDRHILELISDVAASHYVPEYGPYSLFASALNPSRYPFGNWKPRCEECEVSWVGPEVWCWSCGREATAYEPWQPQKLFKEIMADLDRQFEEQILNEMHLAVNETVERYLPAYSETDAAAMEYIYHRAASQYLDFETVGLDDMRVIDEALWRQANPNPPINWNPNTPRQNGHSSGMRYWLDEWVSDRVAVETPSDIPTERPITEPEFFRWRLSSPEEVERYQRLMSGEIQLGRPWENERYR